MTEDVTEDEMLAELARMRADAAHPKFRYLRFPAQAYESYVAGVQNSEGRWMFGLQEIDWKTRGFGSRELAMLTGRPHAGKGQLLLTGLIHNRALPQMFFTFDEPAELVLAKLVAMRLGLDGEHLEEKVRANDAEVLAQVRRVAETEFANLVLIDDPINLRAMTAAVEEARGHFGRPPAVIVIDYLELLRCDAADVEGKAQELKRWVKTVESPVICVHQAGRGRGADGQELTMEAMRYGGEAEATFVIGVQRYRMRPDAVAGSREWDSVTVSVLKNKRPPGKIGSQDYWMDPANGRITAFPERNDFAPLAQRRSAMERAGLA